ncbi:peptide chain release factor N(5)-glutamine methyltransferase [bacterium]|nr:peptide chain release factor N(5)-glutamine methyltransferase [bacterium]
MNQSLSTKKQLKNKAPDVYRLLAWAAGQFRACGMDAPQRHAQEFLMHILGMSRARLLAEPGLKINVKIRERFQDLVHKRLERIPLQYILGYEDFMGIRLQVGPGVLIPRPETELLAAEACRVCREMKSLRLIADLGTGSGNLALNLASHFPKALIYGIDSSPQALYWARRNRRRFPAGRVRLLRGDAELAIPRSRYGEFSLVVSNPPYILRSDIPGLQPEVRYEPRSALDGGPDGLSGIKRMLRAATRLLHHQGAFVCEIGMGQAEAVKKLFKKSGFVEIKVMPDWQNIPRIVTGKWRLP